MKINLIQRNVVPAEEESKWIGFLLTFFEGIEDVVRKRRKGSYLTHLCEERLSKSERKVLFRILSDLVVSISKKKQTEKTVHEEVSEAKDSNSLEKLIRIFNRFQTVSTLPKSRQAPEAGATVKSRAGKLLKEVGIQHKEKSE